jgi:2Fe-2S ferredoxin
MPRVMYIDIAGAARTVEVSVGTSVMQGAVQNNVPGIVAECGGACACATCHVFVDEAWRERVGSPDEAESAMLEFVDDRGPGSRLGCQIAITAELDGLTVRTPERQG